MKFWQISILGVALAGCAASDPPFRVVRVDGRSVDADAATRQHAETALAACEGRRAQTLAMGGTQEHGYYAAAGCLAERGYRVERSR